MGWTYTEKDAATSVKEFFEDEFGGARTRVLDCAVVELRTAYLAIESTAKAATESAEDPRVFAVVCLLDYRPTDGYLNFGYKDISEEMGPVEDHCPERILDLLSPTGYEYALDWRERCHKHVERRRARPSLKSGCYLQLDSPVQFVDGRARTTFYIADARKRRFIADDGPQCNIPRSTLQETGYTVHKDRPLLAATEPV